MSLSIAIVGAGLLGRTLAYELTGAKYPVTVFESDSAEGKNSCGYAGAGMLAPYSELECSHPVIFELGCDTLALWSRIIQSLPQPVYMQSEGTLLVSHIQDNALLTRTVRQLQRKGPKDIEQRWLHLLTQAQLRQYEPSLATRFNSAVFLPLEGQLDNRQLLDSLVSGLAQSDARCIFGSRVISLKPGQVRTEKERFKFDLVIDCRGLQAKTDIPLLRGVRGEMLEVIATDVHILRPVRLMHPRYPIYIVPRKDQRYLIGATVIESDSKEPITVQSAMELLSAAYSIDSAFAEANICQFRVNCRPGLSDNAPRIYHQPGLIRINGLYRHGFLITPKLVELLIQFITYGSVEQSFQSLLQQEAS